MTPTFDVASSGGVDVEAFLLDDADGERGDEDASDVPAGLPTVSLGMVGGEGLSCAPPPTPVAIFHHPHTHAHTHALTHTFSVPSLLMVRVDLMSMLQATVVKGEEDEDTD